MMPQALQSFSSASIKLQKSFPLVTSQSKKEAANCLRRKITLFNDNKTIARKLEFHLLNSEALLSKKNFKNLPLTTSLLNKAHICDAIEDHAFRRILLFYYLNLSYYRTDCCITREKTLHQYGRSQFRWSSAAHSSLLPNIKDDFFSSLKNKLLENGLKQKSRKYLKSFGISETVLSAAPKGPLSEKQVDDLLKTTDTAALLTPQCHFYKNLNSTVEVPRLVNEYDSILESFFREKALKILNNCSQKEEHPYQATKMLVDEMQEFFKKSERVVRIKISNLRRLYLLENKLCFLESKRSKKSLKAYFRTLRNIGKCRQNLMASKQYALGINLKGRLTWQMEYTSFKLAPNNKIWSQLAKKRAESPSWTPKKIDVEVERLEAALKIIKLQKASTKLPDLALLSGKLVDSKLLPMSENELLNQSLELIQRF